MNESRFEPSASPRSQGPQGAPKAATAKTVVQAILLGACVVLGGGLYAHWTSGSPPFAAPVAQTDHLSDRERLLRQQKFVALGPLHLEPVPGQKLSAALDSMRLPRAEREALASAALATQPEPVTAAQAPLRLAWITLWDTDVQDGDVVRIQAEGYSRTVTLTKAGATFAIPVPANGIVRVTGITDGDRGGITVGLGSGASQAVFPIMSPGQTLELKVD